MCLTDLFHNLSPGPLWSSFWSGTLYFILHTFLHPVIIFSQHTPHHRSMFCCSTNVMSSIPTLSPSSLLGNVFFTLMPHINLTTFISAHWSATSFYFLTGQLSLPCNILLQPSSHNQWYILTGKQWYQLPAFIPASSNPGLHSYISISIHTQHVT